MSIRDLKGERLYIESSEFHIHQLILEKCRQAGFEPEIAFETSGFSLCHRMVQKNKGISVTVDFIFDDMGQGNTVMIPFEEGPFYTGKPGCSPGRGAAQSGCDAFPPACDPVDEGDRGGKNQPVRRFTILLRPFNTLFIIRGDIRCYNIIEFTYYNKKGMRPAGTGSVPFLLFNKLLTAVNKALMGNTLTDCYNIDKITGCTE